MVIIAVVCGIIVTILVLSLMILCCMKNPACCYRMDSASKHKPTDVESDKTDVESTHSSNLSAHRDNKMHAIIPPDALYGTVEKKLPSNRFAYIDTADFNNSKESLKPDLLISNLNRTNSS